VMRNITAWSSATHLMPAQDDHHLDKDDIIIEFDVVCIWLQLRNDGVPGSIGAAQHDFVCRVQAPVYWLKANEYVMHQLTQDIADLDMAGKSAG